MNEQRYTVTISFDFEPSVFPGDPDDVYELARLEQEAMAFEAKLFVEDFDGDNLSVTVDPII